LFYDASSQFFRLLLLLFALQVKRDHLVLHFAAFVQIISLVRLLHAKVENNKKHVEQVRRLMGFFIVKGNRVSIARVLRFRLMLGIFLGFMIFFRRKLVCR
jgi:hypothetical protein